MRCHLITSTWFSLETAYAFTAIDKLGLAYSRNGSKIISLRAHEQRNVAIARQSDEKYGRGINHISADINEGEIIAYQTGTWYVDGNAVGEWILESMCNSCDASHSLLDVTGDGSDPEIRYMLVDTIQIVWTHNCEHGVINGFDATIANSKDEGVDGGLREGSVLGIGNDYVQCGPEQVLAKIPAQTGAEKDEYVSLVQFLPAHELVGE